MYACGAAGSSNYSSDTIRAGACNVQASSLADGDSSEGKVA